MKKFLADFKAFASKGNVLDMAVGVIIGGAFGKIVTSLVNDIITPLIGIIIGGVDFTGLSITLGEANITYGNFIQSIIDFLIIALCIFLFIRGIARMKDGTSKLTKKKKGAPEEAPAEPEPPKKSDETLLLEEIRDLLKKQK